MSRTPDAHDGPLYEEEIRLEDRGSSYTPAAAGYMAYADGGFTFRDGVGIFDPRSGGGGITESQHEALDTLVHELAEDFYLEVTRDAGKITNVTYYTDSGKTKKIREYEITRATGKVTVVVLEQYDGDGNLITGQTLTQTITRAAGKVTSIVGVES